jgi:predicted pyridoxine 5'-phosphate oxidase superfamily flavin-nucleotide-binding protein
METTYHAGEISIQEKLGEKAIADRNGRAVTDKIIPGAINFIEKQHFFIASTKDKSGRITVSVLAGENGFLKVKGPSTLEISRNLLYSNPFDAFWSNIDLHQKVGLLFIEPSSRRRFRINGALSVTPEKVVVNIEQAYPNCPKYIQQRHVRPIEKPFYTAEYVSGDLLTPPLIDLLRTGDTFFIGSGDPQGNLDCSHRGGPPGFIHIENENTLVVPDYKGNSMFNTFGNLALNPNAGLLFIDFNNNLNLQLQGSAELILNGDRGDINTDGTNRYWIFRLSKWTLLQNLNGFEWKFIDYSPFNPK